MNEKCSLYNTRIQHFRLNNYFNVNLKLFYDDDDDDEEKKTMFVTKQDRELEI